ncbi:AMP-binding protein [Malikia spinosa]|uniref:AMP-binding protein n=1 Tax=Malikia spinosa TaxID=86180 RepID=A0A7C9MYG5_9BURK|nr:AMP-binding protein [Malikia spinosa]MYZ53161.1 AMP-binding protein [Malikia spinosa]
MLLQQSSNMLTESSPLPIANALTCYRTIARQELYDQPWLVTADRTVSFGELARRIEALAGFLEEAKIVAGQRVVISTRNDAEAALLFVGLICNGITVVNLDPDTGQQRAASLIAKASPCLLVLDPELANVWALPAGGPRVMALEHAAPVGVLGRLLGKKAPVSGFLAALAMARPQEPRDAIHPETLAYILFTSGTTSQPKGVCISHRALFAHLATLQRRLDYTPQSRILNTLMLSHADGMIQGPVMGFYNASPVFRPLRFEVTRITPLLDAVYQLRITHMIAVPTMLAILVRLGGDQRDAFQGGDFQRLISCGAQLDRGLWQDFVSLFQTPLINIYGLTETVVGGVFAGPYESTGVPGSIGQPEDCRLRIVDATGQDMPSGETGALLMQGELLMSGYFDEPEMTSEVLQDGWLHTGDMARLDEVGHYWILGRSKNIIIRGGYNIHPEEVTEVLERHPGVIEAVTFGIEDPVWGETVASLVVTVPGTSVESLLAHCAAQMEPRKVPSQLKSVVSLPRGRSGKVALEQARDLLLANEAVATLEQDVPARLCAIAASCFRMAAENVTLHMTPNDISGWDSLAHMELVAGIEEEFSITLTPREIMTLDCLEKVQALIERKQVDK